MGINSIEKARSLWKIGIEKIGFNFNKINPELVANISSMIGSQSIVLNMDIYKSKLGGFKIYKDKHKLFKSSQEMSILIKKTLKNFKDDSIENYLYKMLIERVLERPDLEFISEL